REEAAERLHDAGRRRREQATGHPADAGVGERRGQRRQPVGARAAVGVGERDDLASGGAGAGVARHRGASPWLTQDDDVGARRAGPRRAARPPSFRSSRTAAANAAGVSAITTSRPGVSASPSAPIVVETTALPAAIAPSIFSRVPPPPRIGFTKTAARA